MLRCGSKNWTLKWHVFKRDWTMWSKYVNRLGLHSQHDWRDLYDHLMSTRIFTFIVNKIFMWAPKVMRQVTLGTIWICYCAFYILREVGVERNCIQVTHMHLNPIMPTLSIRKFAFFAQLWNSSRFLWLPYVLITPNFPSGSRHEIIGDYVQN